MKLITPPKLMPPFQSTAASGTLPIEHTKLSTETTGPMSGPHSLARKSWSTRKKSRQKLFGTHAASAPAMSNPMPMSAQIDAQSMTK